MSICTRRVERYAAIEIRRVRLGELAVDILLGKNGVS
jgi:hypothetical protein